MRSRRPTGNYEGQLRATLGGYHADNEKGARDALIQDYEGVVGFPIVEDWLSSRFAFRFRDADPYKTQRLRQRASVSQRARFRRRQFPIDDPSYRMCGERDFGTRRAGGISQIPEGLPNWVNDQHNWAARGTLALPLRRISSSRSS